MPHMSLLLSLPHMCLRHSGLSPLSCRLLSRPASALAGVDDSASFDRCRRKGYHHHHQQHQGSCTSSSTTSSRSLATLVTAPAERRRPNLITSAEFATESSFAMSSAAPILSRVLANSVCVADRAARIVRDIMASGELGVVEKTGADDLQTRADRSAQDCIVGSLRANFPGLVVIGEEGDGVSDNLPEDYLVKEEDAEAGKMNVPDKYKDTKLEDLTVWVDPLDGTKEYTEGFLDHVTVLIGVAVGDKAVAGVINQPFYNYQAKDPSQMGRTLYGLVGSGVRGIERVLPPADQRIITTTRSHGTGLVNDAAEACKPTEIIRAGGAGHKVMLLIEGKAHAYVFPSPGCKKWDTCAPEAILHAMGGKLTDIHGNLYKYGAAEEKQNWWGTLATSVEAEHAEYLGLIPKEMKDQVKDYFKNKSKKK